MKIILPAVDNRKTLLSKRIAEKEKALRNIPKGRLRVSGGTRNLYYYTDEQKETSRYLGQQELEKARKLAQRDYDQKILRLSQKELEVLDTLSRRLERLSGENVYDTLPPARRRLVTPVEIPDEDFVRCWESEEPEKKSLSEDLPEYYTDRGERVRFAATMKKPYFFDK